MWRLSFTLLNLSLKIIHTERISCLPFLFLILLISLVILHVIPPTHADLNSSGWTFSTHINFMHGTLKYFKHKMQDLRLCVVWRVLPLPVPCPSMPPSPPLPHASVWCVCVCMCAHLRYGHETLEGTLPLGTLCTLLWKTCATDPFTKTICHWHDFKCVHCSWHELDTCC